MKLTVREAMMMTPLKNARVLAGERGLDREVLNVNIVEVPDTVRWMRGGEIMFSGGFAFGGDGDKGCALISSLWDHKITALVLKPGIYMTKVPEAMIEYAEYLGFPLLEVPGDMPFNLYIESIYALLLDKKVLLFNDGAAPFGDSNSVISGELNNICEILANRIKAPVLYLTRSGNLEAVIGEQYLEEGSTGKMPQVLTIEQWREICQLTQVNLELEPRAYLAVFRRKGFPTATDTAMMEYAAMMISSELQKERAFIEQKKQFRSALLNDLISQNFGDPNILSRRCELLQFNPDDLYTAFAVRAISDRTPKGDRENLDIISKDICSLLEHGAARRACSLLLAEECGLVMGVLSFAGQEAVRLTREMLSEMLGTVQNTCKSIRVVCGISSQGSGVKQVAQAMYEAKEALNISMRISDSKPIACMEELGLYRVLCELKKSRVMEDFCRDTLKSILSCENGEELLNTLKCYYNNECNLRKTSEELFLHKNSIKYRLSRIESLLGHSITEPEIELSLKICLKYRTIL